MKKYLLALAFLAPTFAFAAPETCYELSTNETSWSRTPERLCITEMTDNRYLITLKSGILFNEKEFARFNVNLLSAVRCMDCNMNVYGLSNPSNSVFNELSIRFNGKVDIRNRAEWGTVQIGQTSFYYRSVRR